MSSSDPPDDLPPARGLAPKGDLPFSPRINWRFWAPVLVVVVGFPLIWTQRRNAEANRRRAQLLADHANLTASLAPNFLQLRTRIVRWTLDAVGPYPGDLRAPSFTWDGFVADRALYARVRVHEVRDEATALTSLHHRYPDQLTHCLGIEVSLAREVLDKGQFLLPSWPQAVRDASDGTRLHALREDLLFRLRRDTAALLDASRRRYFVLGVDEGRASVQGPTRVMIFDLRDGSPVLRARGRGDDLVFIPFQIHGSPRPVGAMPLPGLSQHDCSVANAVRVVAGVAPLGIQHAPSPAPAGDAAAPRADAAAPADATAPRPDA
ncbi:MAG: hypothetical protein U0325_24285 [Polyangiales bacterium]